MEVSRTVEPSAAEDWLQRIRRMVGAATPRVIGLAGSVAVGKSTVAAEMAMHFAAESGARAEVVATDSFLLPTAVLDARGLTMRKGFPESYDIDALLRFLGAVRRGEPSTIPVYSHRVYDIDGTREVTADVLVLEGVNALDPRVAPLLDVAVYLHAEEALVEEWYTERFLALCAAAESDRESFYAWAIDVDEAGRRAAARWMWDEVNLVNLREHIAPTREQAHVVLVKGPQHRVQEVHEVRAADDRGPVDPDAV